MSSPAGLGNPLQVGAHDIWHKAWGKPWPRLRRGTVRKTDISPADTPICIDENNIEDTYSSDEFHRDIPDELIYDCYDGMAAVAKALCLYPLVGDTLVVLSDYPVMYDALQWLSEWPILVTGHPGIGKTTFLVYALLRRLADRLPTAIQVSSAHYFIFDQSGATVHGTHDFVRKIESCWAFVDNTALAAPSTVFTSWAARLIYVSSPNPRAWKSWMKQTGGISAIMDIPSVLEIAAISKERGFDLSSTVALVSKWGPSIRTVTHLLSRPEHSRETVKTSLVIQAESAAQNICHGSTMALADLDRKMVPECLGSAVLFFRPVRESPDRPTGQVQPFIPTAYLSGIVERERKRILNSRSLELFFALSTHLLTRGRESWIHEKKMHQRLCGDGRPLRIFRGSTERDMAPSNVLLAGTASGMKSIHTGNSFYWLPSVVNLAGVDGVLGDAEENLYVVRATVDEQDASPITGLQRVWDGLRPAVRYSRRWNYVVIAEEHGKAENHATALAGTLALGGGEVEVQVWGCVLAV